MAACGAVVGALVGDRFDWRTAYIIGGVFEPVRQTLAGTFGGPPILGTAFGLIGGTLRGAMMVTRGALELIPVAAKLAPLIPVFL